ncbi:uncharacterized protein LOC133717616 isoform X2 [Rosa rugosa]|uniref:uncharacterized protein LOC133717616 isoform X2 n=1 Tax=Rosa rugosa TaxID=74645 RepID=UPI002B4173D1|nr:uncharacterized protein LOC133717616 isoform X2 [Rosa rugosa]
MRLILHNLVCSCLIGMIYSGGLNFLMYIFVSHILGGLWYFFSVQRMIGCWEYACRNEDGCKTSTFNCHDHRTNGNIKLLNDSCPINPSNAKIFDFGIFLDALQSDLIGSTDYSQKLSNCFWWSLRNLSSLGSNLQPSINTWENLFAAFTSITGLLLFLYLIGNVQMIMQLETATRWKGEVKEMMTIERKTKIERKQGPVVGRWLTKNGLPMHFKSKIMKTLVQVILDQNRDVDEDDIHSILSARFQTDMKRYKEKMEEIDTWLSENALPMRFKSEIMEKIVPELEENMDVDVKNILSILPLKLQRDISVYKKNLEHASRKIELWLSVNYLPMRLKSEIMEKVVQPALEENKDVDVKNIFSILPLKLQWDIWVYKKKLEHASREIELWLSENALPMRFKSEIMEKVVQPELEENRDVDMKNILSILSPKIRSDIWVYKQNLEQESRKIELWLSENYLPMRFKSEIMEKVVQPELEENRVVDVNKLLTMLPSQLGFYIESWMQKMREKEEEINMWLSKNGLPENLKPDIMKTVQVNFEENKDVDVENILSILPVSLQERIRGVKKFDRKVHLWLSENGLPENLKSDIMKAVNFEENKDVDVKNILSILPVPLQVRIRVTKFDQKVDLWLIKNGIPTTEKSYIMKEFRVELEKDGDVDMENFLSIYQRKLEQHMPLNRLKKVKLLEKLDERVLEAICEHLKPVEYDMTVPIIREGQPLKMILFVQGFVYTNPNKNKGFHADGKIWGEELLVWPSSTSFPAVLPKATESLFSNFGTRSLVLTASDMENIGCEYRPQFDLLTSHWLTMLKKVPKLERMDEEVLKAIFLHLKQNSSAVYHCIENRPFQSMNFITEGYIKFTRDTDCRFELIRSHGEVFGEELLDWVLDPLFPALTPLSTYTAYTNREAVVLSITAEELKSVASEFESYFSTFRKESQPDLLTFVGMTLLKEVPKLKTMDEEVLKAISQHLKIQQYGKYEKIIDQGKPLDRMLFLLRGELLYYGPTSRAQNVGLFFGEKLIDWLPRCSDATIPLSEYSVTTPFDSEKALVLILMANDLKRVVSEFKSRFS